MKEYVATIGFFDGVHLGHQFLIGQLLDEAARWQLDSAVITFEHHPKEVLTHEPPELLNTYDERIAHLKSTGLDEIFCFQFDIVHQMTAREFMQVLYSQCGVRVLLMGYDHRFGSDQLTNIEDYIRLGSEIGLTVSPQHQAPEGAVSSTKIRRALLAGSVEEANLMLSYTYTLEGQVVHGRRIGHELGFPTANIELTEGKLIPKDGVYAVWAESPSNHFSRRKAILNIGTNPTVGNLHRTIEVHIPGFQGDLYNETLRLGFICRVRDEQHFESLTLLREQIQQDLKILENIG